MSRPDHLILLPGLLCDADLWAHQATHLAGLAGISIPDLTGAEAIDDLADAVLAAAPERFALAGLSMGGYVALAILRKAPERVDRLALLNSSARADTREQSRRRRGLIALARRGKFKGVTPRLLPWLVHPDRLEEPALVDPIMAMAERVGTEAFIRQERAILGRPDSRHRLAEIACPALVVAGRQDALTPVELAEEAAALLPRARLAIIEDCGHLSTMERPQAVTALLRDWLVYR
jgi:pimeloyl-ACP methyl ester carboxylesterase